VRAGLALEAVLEFGSAPSRFSLSQVRLYVLCGRPFVFSLRPLPAVLQPTDAVTAIMPRPSLHPTVFLSRPEGADEIFFHLPSLLI